MNTTRKHPRTLHEAFGPYTGRDFKDDPMPFADKLIMCICGAACLALVAMAVAGWL
jgi:hypothetical protein